MIERLSIKINGLEGVSTNEMYYTYPSKGGRSTYRARTAGYNSYREVVNSVLTEIMTDETYSDIISKVISRVQSNEVTYSLFGVETTIPTERYTTKSGDLSSMDASNFLKSIEDAWVEACNTVIPDISYDDKYHSHTHSTKMPGDIPCQVINLSVVDHTDPELELTGLTHSFEVDYEWYEIPPTGRQRKPRHGIKVLEVRYILKEYSLVDHMKELIVGE